MFGLTLLLNAGCNSASQKEADSGTNCIPEELKAFRHALAKKISHEVIDSICLAEEPGTLDNIPRGALTSYSYSTYTVKFDGFKPEFLIELWTYSSRSGFLEELNSGMIKSPMILMEQDNQVYILSTQAQMNKGDLRDLFEQVESFLQRKYGFDNVIKLNM